MPAGVLVTAPLPVPDLVTVSANIFSAKVAVTLFASLIETVQVPVPVHAPLQPVNVESFAAAAVSVTLVPELKLALQD
jgi:hypothetical protein